MSGLELFSYYYLLLMSVNLLSEIGWEYKQDSLSIRWQTRQQTRQPLILTNTTQTQLCSQCSLNYDYSYCLLTCLLSWLSSLSFSLILVSVSFSHDFEVKNMKTIMMIVMMICWELVMMTLNINELSSIRVQHVSLMFVVSGDQQSTAASNKQIL